MKYHRGSAEDVNRESRRSLIFNRTNFENPDAILVTEWIDIGNESLNQSTPAVESYHCVTLSEMNWKFILLLPLRIKCKRGAVPSLALRKRNCLFLQQVAAVSRNAIILLTQMKKIWMIKTNFHRTAFSGPFHSPPFPFAIAIELDGLASKSVMRFVFVSMLYNGVETLQLLGLRCSQNRAPFPTHLSIYFWLNRHVHLEQSLFGTALT